MILIIFILFGLAIIGYLVKNKVIIRVDTFFRKGFEKHDDKYRSLLLRREAGRPVKLTALLIL